jgi:hypothetical protein
MEWGIERVWSSLIRSFIEDSAVHPEAIVPIFVSDLQLP